MRRRLLYFNRSYSNFQHLPRLNLGPAHCLITLQQCTHVPAPNFRSLSDYRIQRPVSFNRPSTSTMDVQLYVYDLTRGMARLMSRGLLGIQIDAVYHTVSQDIVQVARSLVTAVTHTLCSLLYLGTLNTFLELEFRRVTQDQLIMANQWKSSRWVVPNWM